MTAASDTTERILEAASGLFAQRGYQGTTTRAIAEAAGVNEVTVFRRFTSKRGVLVALAASWTKNMAGFAVAELPEPSDTHGTLQMLARIEVEQAQQVGPAAMRLALDARTTPEVAQVMGDGPGSNFAGLVDYLTERREAGDLRSDLDPRVMAEVFFSVTSQIVMSRQILDADGHIYEVPVEQAVRQAVEIYWAGVSAGRPARTGSQEDGSWHE